MRVCDSVCQNRCRMQGICVVGDCSNTDTQHRVSIFIQYLYPDETLPETRKRLKKWADLLKAKVGEPVRGAVEDFFDLGLLL